MIIRSGLSGVGASSRGIAIHLTKPSPNAGRTHAADRACCFPGRGPGGAGPRARPAPSDALWYGCLEMHRAEPSRIDDRTARPRTPVHCRDLAIARPCSAISTAARGWARSNKARHKRTNSEVMPSRYPAFAILKLCFRNWSRVLGQTGARPARRF
jgi:hypothetical protein